MQGALWGREGQEGREGPDGSSDTDRVPCRLKPRAQSPKPTQTPSPVALYPNVAITGAWSLVPMSRWTGQAVARVARGALARM